MKYLSTAVIGLSLLLAGCGKKGGVGSYTTAESGDKSAADPILAEADKLWEARVEEDKLKAAIDKYKEAHEADPANRKALVRVTRGLYFWGDGFTDDKDTKLARWQESIEYGKKCIALNEEVANRINGGEKEADAITAAVKADVPCIYWTATALGKWAKAQSLSKTLKYIGTVKAYMTQAETLNAEYFHYGPARYWGAYYSALPSFAGRDLEKSEKYFEASLQGAPKYFGTYVLRADYLWVLKENVAGFDEDIEHVLSTEPNVLPEVAPENTKEREKAKALKAKRGELFSKKALETAGQ